MSELGQILQVCEILFRGDCSGIDIANILFFPVAELHVLQVQDTEFYNIKQAWKNCNFPVSAKFSASMAEFNSIS